MSDFRVGLDRLRTEGCVLLGDDTNDFGRSYQIIVVLDEHGEPQAYKNECEHIAVPLGLFADSIFDKHTLLCATHGARYRADDGYCFEGPCVGQSLGRLPFEVDGDTVVVRWDESDLVR